LYIRQVLLLLLLLQQADVAALHQLSQPFAEDISATHILMIVQ
jgi:hypothetical protein